MTDPWKHLQHHYDLQFASIPRPIATVPLHPVTEPCDLPTDRSDFTRDSELSGV